MARIHAEQSAHHAPWRAAEFTKEKVCFDLGPRHLAAFERWLREARSRGLTLLTAADSDLRIEEVRDDIAQISDEIMNRRGVVIVRGWPVDRYTVEEIGLLYLAFGKQMGWPVLQNQRGDRVASVMDLGANTVRGYTSNRELGLHTDFEDIVALLVIRKARSGGVTRLASSLAIHEKIAATRPEHLAPLQEGYHLCWQGEAPAGEPSFTDYRIPVFSEAEGQLSAYFVRDVMERAARERGQPITGLRRAALDHFEEVAESEELMFSFTLEPGELLLINNHTLVHSRTAFEDWPDPEQRRLLLRMWLKVPEGRPIHPNLRRFYGHDGWRVPPGPLGEASAGRAPLRGGTP